MSYNSSKYPNVRKLKFTKKNVTGVLKGLATLYRGKQSEITGPPALGERHPKAQVFLERL